MKDTIQLLSQSLLVEECLKEGESYITISELMKRTKIMNDLAGETHARALYEQRELIPKKFQELVLIFPAGVQNNKPMCLAYWRGQWKCSRTSSYGIKCDSRFRIVRLYKQ